MTRPPIVVLRVCACALISLAAQSQSAQTSPEAGRSEDHAADLLQRSVQIKSIDPSNEDFADLEPLRNLIGDSRLVVLGEQSHGDGAVFYAKARLIKFLHQKMGFDVLAWESGMFDCREVDRAMRDPAIKMEDIGRMGIFPIWTASAQVRPTLDYVRTTLSTEHPIETCGFDHQFSGGAQGHWPASVIALFDRADANLLPADVRESLTTGFAKMFDRGEGGKMDPANVEPLQAIWARVPVLMDEHRAAIEKANSADEFAFVRRCADDAVVSVKSLLEFMRGQGKMKATDNNTRDQRMAENLVWLVNQRYKGRKIIAWMATMHAVHDVQRITGVFGQRVYEGVTNCGTVASPLLGQNMYTIGFTAAEGKAGNVWAAKPFALQPPSKGSLEDFCLQTGKPFLFIDFRSSPADHWLRKPLVSRPLGYGEMLATEGWHKQVDAMFYIRTMFPSTKENALPPYAVLQAE